MLSGKEFFSKVVLPILGIGVLLLIFVPVCIKETGIDYFLLWICVGCPFGIGKMFAWLVPRNFDIGGSIGIIALNFIIGGLIGGLIAIYKLICAVYYFVLSVATILLKCN